MAWGFLRGLFHKRALAVPLEPDPVRAPPEPGVSTPVQGNTLELFIDGDAFERNLTTQIDAARQSVWLAYYLFDMKEGSAVEAAIVRALERGVTVRIVADDRDTAGEFIQPRLNPTLERLRAAGAQIVHARTTGVAVNHRKLGVFDGRKAVVTGMNLTSNYTKGGAYHDAGVLLEGPAVRDVAEAFAESWQTSGGRPIALPPRSAKTHGAHSDAWVSMIRHEGQKDRNIERELLQRIDASTRTIRLANPFGMTDAIEEALIRAQQRGVRVEWLWGWQFTREDAVMSLDTIRRLLAADVAIYEYPGMLHAKLFVFDDLHTIVGSSNLEGYSTWLNDEASLQITSRAFAEDAVARFFTPDFANSKRLDAPPRASSGGRVKDWALRLLARKLNAARLA